MENCFAREERPVLLGMRQKRNYTDIPGVCWWREFSESSESQQSFLSWLHGTLPCHIHWFSTTRGGTRCAPMACWALMTFQCGSTKGIHGTKTFCLPGGDSRHPPKASCVPSNSPWHLDFHQPSIPSDTLYYFCCLVGFLSPLEGVLILRSPKALNWLTRIFNV